jgi:hypothetical protein
LVDERHIKYRFLDLGGRSKIQQILDLFVRPLIVFANMATDGYWISASTVRALWQKYKRIYIDASHHAEGQFNPNPMNKKIVTDFGYPRACRFRKYQI